MVDLNTREIVDMIESRETEDVRRWLEEYPNLCVVSRDGLYAFASAISESHPGAVQISDRFHLVKNLADYATDALQKLFQGRIGIPITSETQRIRTTMFTAGKSERVLMVKGFHQEGRSKNEISVLTGVSLKTVSRYLDTPDNEIRKDKQTSRGSEHENAVEKLRERAERVRFMYESGCSLTTM